MRSPVSVQRRDAGRLVALDVELHESRVTLPASDLGVLTLSDGHDDGPAIMPGLVTATVITAPALSRRRISVLMLTLSDLATR